MSTAQPASLLSMWHLDTTQEGNADLFQFRWVRCNPVYWQVISSVLIGAIFWWIHIWISWTSWKLPYGCLINHFPQDLNQKTMYHVTTHLTWMGPRQTKVSQQKTARAGCLTAHLPWQQFQEGFPPGNIFGEGPENKPCFSCRKSAALLKFFLLKQVTDTIEPSYLCQTQNLAQCPPFHERLQPMLR